MKIRVIKLDKEYGVEFSQGVQYFRLDFKATKKECEFMKGQLRNALLTAIKEAAK